MSDIPLASKYSAETFDKALSNLLERWKQKGDDEPVKYDEAAIGMDKSTVSVALKYMGDIGLLEVPKAGSYVVPADVLTYRTKMGEVKREAKREVAARLEDYPLYQEIKFMLGVEDYVLKELAEEVSGSAAVAASQDELRDVERSINVLAELGFLEVDEEDYVSVPSDLDGAPETEIGEEGEAPEEGAGANESESDVPSKADDEGSARREMPDAKDTPLQRSTSLSVDMDISMDVTEMEAEEVKKKLGVINDILGQNEK